MSDDEPVTEAANEPPPVWSGHISVNAADIAASSAFYVSLGMREIVTNDRVSVLELRGGTHLVVLAGEPAESASFDLMVEDLDATHAAWSAAGLEPGEIRRGDIHDAFDIVDPAGTLVTVNSSHVVGVV